MRVYNICLFVTFTVCVGIVACGAEMLTPDEEAQAWQLYQRSCEKWADRNFRAERAGETQILCAGDDTNSPKPIEIAHYVVLIPQPQPQIIFIRPTPTKHVHKVVVTGNYERATQNTKIFVLPKSDKHKFNYVKSSIEPPSTKLHPPAEVYYWGSNALF